MDDVTARGATPHRLKGCPSVSSVLRPPRCNSAQEFDLELVTSTVAQTSRFSCFSLCNIVADIRERNCRSLHACSLEKCSDDTDGVAARNIRPRSHFCGMQIIFKVCVCVI